MSMLNPVHPGEILREDVFEPLEIGVKAAAEHLGVSRVQLSRVLNLHAGISTELAMRLEKAGVSTARQWLAVQANYDLWKAGQIKQKLVVKKFHFA